jgi:hypothetical protein
LEGLLAKATVVSRSKQRSKPRAAAGSWSKWQLAASNWQLRKASKGLHPEKAGSELLALGF